MTDTRQAAGTPEKSFSSKTLYEVILDLQNPNSDLKKKMDNLFLEDALKAHDLMLYSCMLVMAQIKLEEQQKAEIQKSMELSEQKSNAFWSNIQGQADALSEKGEMPDEKAKNLMQEIETLRSEINKLDTDYDDLVKKHHDLKETQRAETKLMIDDLKSKLGDVVPLTVEGKPIDFERMAERFNQPLSENKVLILNNQLANASTEQEKQQVFESASKGNGAFAQLEAIIKGDGFTPKQRIDAVNKFNEELKKVGQSVPFPVDHQKRGAEMLQELGYVQEEKKNRADKTEKVKEMGEKIKQVLPLVEAEAKSTPKPHH